MSARREQIFEVLRRALSEINLSRPAHRHLDARANPELIGASGLDSLEVVTFLSLVESDIQTKLGRPCDLSAGGVDAEMGRSIRSLDDMVDWIVRVAFATNTAHLDGPER